MPAHSHDRDQGPPRNYFGIQPAGAPQMAKRLPHDQLVAGRYTGALELRLEALSDVHVGSGQYARQGSDLVREPLRRDGMLVIPGSSLKGSCRQVYEVLTNSGSPFEDRAPRHDDEATTVAAALFGALGLQGRLSFDDAEPEAAITPKLIHLSAAYLPKRALGRRFYGPVPPGAQQPPRIPAWAIPAGTRLRTRARFRNASDSEWGGVMRSLGLGDGFVPRLGGGKYDGYGCVRFEVLSVRLRAARGFGAATRHDTPDAVQAFCRRCIDAFAPTPEGELALRQLRDKLVGPAGARTNAEARP